MTGGKNVFDYITTEGKRTGKRTALEYFQKNTGVFNDKGMISQEQVNEMKARLKKNKGHIFHGFISLNEEQSYKIDTPEKCIELITVFSSNYAMDELVSKLDFDKAIIERVNEMSTRVIRLTDDFRTVKEQSTA